MLSTLAHGAQQSDLADAFVDRQAQRVGDAEDSDDDCERQECIDETENLVQLPDLLVGKLFLCFQLGGREIRQRFVGGCLERFGVFAVCLHIDKICDFGRRQFVAVRGSDEVVDVAETFGIVVDRHQFECPRRTAGELHRQRVTERKLVVGCRLFVDRNCVGLAELANVALQVSKVDNRADSGFIDDAK